MRRKNHCNYLMHIDVTIKLTLSLLNIGKYIQLYSHIICSTKYYERR